MDVITAAIKYADRPTHKGAGYTLFIRTVDGNEEEYAVHATNGGPPGERVLCKRDSVDEVFFNTDHIVSVRVEW